MRKKIAIISSYGEECGVAFYSRRLKAILEKRYEVDVLRLDQSLLHSKNRRLRERGTQHIREIAAQLKNYDGICMQLEPGLYAKSLGLAYKRMMLLLTAHKNILVDIHWFYAAHEMGLVELALAFLKGNVRKLGRQLLHSYYSIISTRFWKRVRKMGIKVHTFCRSDAVHLDYYFQIDNVNVFPIIYYSDEDIAAMRKSVNRKELLNRYGLDETKKYIGVFGFLAYYKGHLIAIKSLEYLPEDYHVLIVGGEHPHGLTKLASVPKYLRFMNAFINGDEVAPREALFNPPAKFKHQVYINNDLNNENVYNGLVPVRKLGDRVHFPGQLSDEEMSRFYCAVDYAVHPYLQMEDSQSASGPATLAFELAPRALYSNARVFRQMENLFKGAMAFFGIGNYKELAESVLRYDNFAAELEANRAAAREIYNPETMTDAYGEWFGFEPAAQAPAVLSKKAA